MIILNCPHCSEPVTASPGMRATARVRCPLCLTEYALAEALQKLPPALIALDEPGAEESGELQLEPAWDARGGESSSGATWMTSDPGSAAATGPRVVTRARPKRPAKSPLVEVIKVVAGGVAGLVIAVLVLWWFPVERLRRDPLQLGPKVGAIPWLKFIVPVSFRPKSLVEEDGESNSTRVPPREPKFGGPFGAPAGAKPTDNSSGITTLGGQVDWNEVLKSKQELAEPDTPKPSAKKPGAAKPKASVKPRASDDQAPVVDDRDDTKSSAKDPLNLNLDLLDPGRPAGAAKPAKKVTPAADSAPSEPAKPATPKVKDDEPAASDDETDEPLKPTDKPATPTDSSPAKPVDAKPSAPTSSDSPPASPN